MTSTFSVNTDIYEVMPKVTKLNLNPVSQIEQEWLSEAYLKIIEGNFKGNINLGAYSEACAKNSHLVRIKKGEVPLLSMDENLQGHLGVVGDMLIDSSWVNDFRGIEDNADIKFYVKNFIEMREYVLLEDGKDIWRLLYLSMQYNKKAQRKLRWVIEQYDGLEELITQVILIPSVFNKLSSILGLCDITIGIAV